MCQSDKQGRGLIDHMVQALQRKIAIGSGNRSDMTTREEKQDRERFDNARRVFEDNTKGLLFGKDQRKRCDARPAGEGHPSSDLGDSSKR